MDCEGMEWKGLMKLMRGDGMERFNEIWGDYGAGWAGACFDQSMTSRLEGQEAIL